ncbi:LEM-3-like GIY-YIG domain-containing protein [Fundidesulfovibrio terrae]|uniref:LEM-3-like GIY-YIG domain-containing protein n=1 Tax=Fundidesulfovibrio terrae TaxID=2922866 RepID=UPI001FAF99D2|nr:hypothetical protein [Fundidesulfovibrio terrae]
MADENNSMKAFCESIVMDVSVAEKVGAYVYMMVCPDKRIPFYIGKGRGSRVLSHFYTAADCPELDSSKLEKIRSILSQEKKPLIYIVRHGLSDDDAIMIESALIDTVGTLYDGTLTNMQSGHDSAKFGIMSLDSLVAEYRAEKAEINFPAMLIKINRNWKRTMTDEEIYNATRTCWKVNTGRAGNASRVLAVANGLIRAVFIVSKWKKATADQFGTDVSALNRKEFVGEHDNTGEYSHLLGKSVQHISKNSQSPILYVNC